MTDTPTITLSAGDVLKMTSGPFEGQLRYFRDWTPPGPRTPGGLVRHSPTTAGAQHSSAFAGEGDTFELVPAPNTRSGYDMVHHLLPRILGWKRWESIEPCDAGLIASNIAAGSLSGGIAGLDPAPYSGHRTWARFLPMRGQGGGYTGEAYVLVWQSGTYVHDEQAAVALAAAVKATITGTPAPGDLAAALAAFEVTRRYSAMPKGYLVSVCKHEKVDGGSANHSRGWHPGACAKCGMDMTVDSGD